MNRTARRLLPAVAVVAAVATCIVVVAGGADSARAAKVGDARLAHHPEATTTTPTSTVAGPASEATPSAPVSAKPSPPAARGQVSSGGAVRSASPTQVEPAPDHGDGADEYRCGTGNGSYSPARESEFRGIVARAWVLCNGPALAGGPEIGLELRPDGGWSELTRTADGRLARVEGPRSAGTWYTVDTSEMNGRPTYQVNFRFDDGAEIIAPTTFGELAGGTVSRARFDNMGTVSDYVPVPAGTEIVGPTPPRCALPSGPSPKTQDDFDRMVTAAWVLCSGTSALASSEDGIELRADGRWSKLERTANGTFLRLSGWGNEGSWDSTDYGEQDGRRVFMVNLLIDPGDAIVYAFADISGNRMVLNNMEVHIGHYASVPPGTVVGA
jgi:hypothetical protein